jgi:NAD(P)H-hydrate repair Nnr-like enzyme with NAD(P)H-hydrate epimerase domain
MWGVFIGGHDTDGLTNSTIIAVDCPSGVDCDTAKLQISDAADLTVTMAAVNRDVETACF